MSRHRLESYHFLNTYYRFCRGTHLHQHKMEGGKGSLKSKKDRECETGRKNRFDGLSSLTGVIQILTPCAGWTLSQAEEKMYGSLKFAALYFQLVCICLSKYYLHFVCSIFCSIFL